MSENPIASLSNDSLFDKTIIYLLTEGDTKYVKFAGYGCERVERDSKNKETKEKSFLFIQYNDLKIPLSEAMPDLYECEFLFQHKDKTIKICTADELRKIYLEYDNGNEPKTIIVNDINEETPDGCYLLFRIEDEPNTYKKIFRLAKNKIQTEINSQKDPFLIGFTVANYGKKDFQDENLAEMKGYFEGLKAALRIIKTYEDMHTNNNH